MCVYIQIAENKTRHMRPSFAFLALVRLLRGMLKSRSLLSSDMTPPSCSTTMLILSADALGVAGGLDFRGARGPHLLMTVARAVCTLVRGGGGQQAGQGGAGANEQHPCATTSS